MIYFTKSVCPKCRIVLPAKIYFDNENTIIEKVCSKHGKFKSLHSWDTEELYKIGCREIDEEIRCSFPINSPIQCEKCKKHLISQDLVLFTTGKCNLNCDFCYDGARSHIDDFYVDDIERILINYPNLKRIQLSGGEVTMREDLFSILSFMKKSGFGVSIVTNGTRTSNEDYVKELKASKIDFVVVSIEKNLRSKKIEGYAFKSIDNLKKYNIRFVISSTITEKNINEIKNIVKFAILHGASAIRLAPYHITKFNERPISNIRFSDVVKAFCDSFGIKMEDIIQQHEFRCMGERITNYLRSGIHGNNIPFLHFWFVRKNGNIKKYNKTFQFKLMCTVLRLLTNCIVLKFLRNVNRYLNFVKYLSYKTLFNDNFFLVQIQNTMNPYNIDLRFLQNSKGIIITRKDDIKHPIPYCYSHMIRGDID